MLSMQSCVQGSENSGAGKKRSAGRKRKALLELLDQVRHVQAYIQVVLIIALF